MAARVLIATDRLDLCAPDLADVEALTELWSDPETMRHIGDGTPWTAEKVRARIERAILNQANTGCAFWTARLRETGGVIGQCGIVPIEFNGSEFELGYRLGRAHWGLGLATEGATAAADYGLRAHEREGLELGRLVAVTNEDNAASRRVLAKVGFGELGTSDLYYNTRCVLHELTAEMLARSRQQSAR